MLLAAIFKALPCTSTAPIWNRFNPPMDAWDAWLTMPTRNKCVMVKSEFEWDDGEGRRVCDQRAVYQAYARQLIEHIERMHIPDPTPDNRTCHHVRIFWGARY
jgi:hypothetical protein